jgi:hypothetical protein
MKQIAVAVHSGHVPGLGEKASKPLFVLAGTGAASDRLRVAYPDYFDERAAVRAVYVEDPAELAALACAAGRGTATDFG